MLKRNVNLSISDATRTRRLNYMRLKMNKIKLNFGNLSLNFINLSYSTYIKQKVLTTAFFPNVLTLLYIPWCLIYISAVYFVFHQRTIRKIHDHIEHFIIDNTDSLIISAPNRTTQ